MGIAKTIDISKLSEAQQNLFKSLFEQFCEKSEQKESGLSGKSTFRPAFGQGSESERHFWKWQFQDLKYSKTGRVRRKGKLTDKVRPVLLQRYGLRKYGKRIRERGLQDRQM